MVFEYTIRAGLTPEFRQIVEQRLQAERESLEKMMDLFGTAGASGSVIIQKALKSLRNSHPHVILDSQFFPNMF